MVLSPANKNLFTILFILYLQNKIFPNNGILLNEVLIAKLLNNPLASSVLINLNFLLSHNAHFDKSISFTLFVFSVSGF